MFVPTLSLVPQNQIDTMTPSIRTKPLTVCISRCAELIHDLNDVPQFQGLQQQVKALLSALLSMMRAVHPNNLDPLRSDPSYSAGLSLLAAYLHKLGKTCGYYGTGAETEWQLSDRDRAFVLDEVENPFDRLAEMLSYLAQTLQALIDDSQTDYKTRMEKLCNWAESTFEDWNFFQGELEAARVLAAATSTSRESHSTAGTPTTADESFETCCDKVPQKPEPQKASVWVEIGEQLTEEGIQDDAIEKVANDLKACVRSLVRGELPNFEPTQYESADLTANTKISTSDNPKASNGALAEHSTQKSKTKRNTKPKIASAPSEDWFDRDVVSSKVAAALAKIKAEYDICLAELSVVALKQETDKDSRNYRQVLDMIYTMACRDTSRSRLHARVAKDLQAKTPARIRNIMVSKDAGTVQSGEGPVTGYLFKKCSVDWDHGKDGSSKISVENFALGLSGFIGDLARFGVFSAGQVHSFVRAQWGATLKRNQFMAVYKLLKATGPMLDSQSDKSDMEDHFKRISRLRDKKKSPEIVKELAQELSSLRNAGWKSKQTKVMDQVEEALRKKL